MKVAGAPEGATGGHHAKTDDNTILDDGRRPYSGPGVTSKGLPFAVLEPLDGAGVAGRLLDDGRLSLRPSSAVMPEVRTHVAGNARAVADAVEARSRIAEMCVDLTQRAAQRMAAFWPSDGARLLGDRLLSSIERRINHAGAQLDYDAVERGCHEYVAWARALVTGGARS